VEARVGRQPAGLVLADGQPVAGHSIREGDVQAIQITLAEPLSTEVTLRASFALNDTSGIGHLTLPRLEAVADRTTRRWLAVSASDPLQASVSTQPAEEVTRQEFAAAWGDDDLPTVAYRLADNAPLALDVLPRPPRIAARQVVTFGLAAARTNAEFEAIVNVTDGPVFQHRLRLPDGWQVTEATVTDGMAMQPLRVATGTGGICSLFLPAGAMGEHRLLVTASGPLKIGKWTVPAIELLDAGDEPPLVFLERSDELRTKVLAHPGYESVPDTSAPPHDVL